MNNKKKTICVLGGIFFVFGYIFNQLQNLFQIMHTIHLAELIAFCFAFLSNILGVLFIVLLLMILFGKKIFFLQRFMDKFPKITTYLYYIGYIGYILFAIDVLILLPLEFINLSEITQKYIVWIISILNIGGLILALFLASCKFKDNCFLK